ncbi:MAG: YdjY domain-containing protein [Planctomycetia bacterium]|nr:YdjY domain-containing protein [Planctomycetia bacterium]
MSLVFARRLIVFCALGALVVLAGSRLPADPPGPPKPDAEPDPQQVAASEPVLPVPTGAIRLDPKALAWIDRPNKQVMVDGKICLRQGPLEVFACPKGTKEHEAIVSIDAKPSILHAGLLALGAKSGKPARFDKVYTPATGQEVDIFVVWKDDKGQEHKVPGQELVLDGKTKQPMKNSWVFAGSGFWKDEVTGQEYYKADAGEFICLSNFVEAMLDVPVESTAENSGLMFQANTDKIPPVGTRVRLLLVPKLDAPAGAAK